MLIPSGKFDEHVTPRELYEKLKRRKIKNGYFRGRFVTPVGRFEGVVVFRDREPVLAELRELNLEKHWKGDEALERVTTLLLDAMMRSDLNVRIEVCKLKKSEVDYSIKMNPDFTIKVREVGLSAGVGAVGVKEDSKTLSRFERIVNLLGGEVVGRVNLEEYLKGLNEEFTGIVYAKSDDYYAEVYVREGVIVGARVVEGVVEGEGRIEYKGDTALYYLDRECEVSVKRLFSLRVPDDFRVTSDESVLDKIEVVVDDRLENLIEQVRNARRNLKTTIQTKQTTWREG